MIDYTDLFKQLRRTGLRDWLKTLPPLLAESSFVAKHGDYPKWKAILEALPPIEPSTVDLTTDCIRVGMSDDSDQHTLAKLEQLLRRLRPWRKGPFNLFGIHIDAEWRSDLKWNRLCGYIEPLGGRKVLDVGCGNGYYCWKMAGAGAELIIGIDPTLLYVMQNFAIKHYVGPQPVYVLPLGIDDVPAKLNAFDTVFSMGVLYHRRSPIDHLFQLLDCLRKGGQLVLETLVIDGGAGQILVPEERYAKMRNVWFLPSCATLISWLKRCGFTDIQLIDVTKTTPEEQRVTKWMEFESLTDFINPHDPNLTIEGLPAPKRGIFLAKKPV
jgi:tRNA (mo5U34)-methyltransferase